MPPDDPIFQPTPAAAQAAGTTPTGTPITSESVAKMVSEAVAPVAQAVGTLNKTISDLRDGATTPQRPTSTAPATTGDEWQERFFADTRGAIDQRVNEQTAPIVAQSAQTVGTLILANEEQRIDAKYGPGTWKSEVWPELESTWNRVLANEPARLLNKAAITNAVDTIVGAKDDRLFELRQKHQTSTAEAAAKRETDLVAQVTGKIAPNLTGGARRFSGGEPKLSDEHRVHLEAIIRDTGETIGPAEEKRLANLMAVKGTQGTGTTYAQWKAAQGTTKPAEAR